MRYQLVFQLPRTFFASHDALVAFDGESFTNVWPYRDPRPFAYIDPRGLDPFSAASRRRIPKRSPAGVSKFETPAAATWEDDS